jgi:hypothetical protein
MLGYLKYEVSPMKPERISAGTVRVRMTISAEAWRDFEALVPRFRPTSPEALFEMVISAGLHHMATVADNDERVRAAARRALEGVEPGRAVAGPVP